MTYQAILAPLRLGDVEIPNRVVRASHLTQYTRQGEVTDKFVAYHEARARGGVGLSILESGTVDHAVSPAPLDASSERVVQGWALVTRESQLNRAFLLSNEREHRLCTTPHIQHKSNQTIATNQKSE